jgi:AcrR family transcriptional regulator
MSTTTNTPTRHDRRRERTREAILDAAERAFTAAGFADSRIDAIADEADVAVGSIYVHFGGKVGLWSALAERALERFDAYLQQAYQPEWTALEQVIACGDAYLRFHAEHPGSFRFLAFDGAQSGLEVDDPELQERIAGRVAAILGGFESKIAEAMASGEARPGDARLYARFLWAAWNGTVALTARADGLALTDEEATACLQQARTMVLEGLSSPAARDADGRSSVRIVSIESPPES